MIFSRVYCCISNKMIFQFTAKEVFPNSYCKKKYITDELILVAAFISNHLDFHEGTKYYNLKNKLWDENRMPIFIKSGEYFTASDIINTKVEIYCLKKDYEFIKKKAA